VTVRLPRRDPGGAVPYPEPDVFARAARRTTLVRLALALAIAAAAALELGVARGGGVTEAAYLPTNGTSIVVMDFSYSITGSSYRLIVNGLRKIAAAGNPVGLIGFSDVAYELLPPGTPARELEPVARLFIPIPTRGGEIRFPSSPWSPLQGGTRISTGLRLADESLQRAGVRKASVILVSDLETASEDAPSVVDAVASLQRHGYSLHLVGLDATAPSLHFFEGLAGKQAFVREKTLEASVQHPGSSGLLSGQTPWAFLLGAALLAALLAANEAWSGELDLSGLRRGR
jgi:VWA domain containing CoxE-like protein